MTEKDFWLFLKQAWATKGRVSQVSGSINSDNLQVQKQGEYMTGHSVLPEGYDKIPTDKIVEMGKLLLDRQVQRQTKEAILMILAHHPSKVALNALKVYNKNPDKELKIFAELALQECEW